jgi:hypothetical protein
MIKVVETKFEQIDGDDTRLAFIGDDNKNTMLNSLLRLGRS